MRVFAMVILGEPASLKNSRRLVTTGRGRHARRRVIKSEKAMGYMDSARWQATQAMGGRAMLKGRLGISGLLYYRTERPDLDGEAICDALQGIVYANDRQLRAKVWDHRIDKANPRAEIVIFELEDEDDA